MPKSSAGLILFRRGAGGLEVLLVHPGGPFWAKRDEGSWSIPKGELAGDEDPLNAARRECQEEIGVAPTGEFIALHAVRQPGGKLVHAWAVEGEFDPAALKSNTFHMEWPPRSGQQKEFPEVDQAEWFTIVDARRKMLEGQTPFLDQLLRTIPQER